MASEQTQSKADTLAAGTSFCFCSVGMLLFNKFAIVAFPYECTLVAAQMLFAAAALLIFTWNSLHIGSMHDLLRWSMVAPFFSGMLLTSILALKNAPMSLVVTLRCLSPLGALLLERLYPNPLAITWETVLSIMVMFGGAAMYISQATDSGNMAGIGWVFFNSAIAVAERCLQRYMLSKDQNPVDISKTGVTLINNLLGSVPLAVAAYATGELSHVHTAIGHLTHLDKFYLLMSCIIGLGISYTGVWAQSLISATSFLVMVNANKFIIIGIEAFVMHSKSLSFIQMCGACITILGACLYGQARQNVETSKKLEQAQESETEPLLAKKV